ncbi:hypothetical protein [Chryseobacterium sp. FH1]|uniref:hypothetical protein n=1 Tax=Chryseobacterium sp. FH1 TaxID=1233951 RepID=UPI000691E5FD|nr:hypothetical protein [Chryseobacterium sp. FH1]
MKLKKNISIFTLILTFSLLTFNSSCSERNETVSCFPNTLVSVSTNLNLQPYINNLQQKGWTYIDEQQAGTRGLILVKNLNGQIYVFDRNAPHICPSSDTTLDVVNNQKIVCPKDGAEWIMSSGQPINDQTKGVAPKRYMFDYNPSTGQISIYN